MCTNQDETWQIVRATLQEVADELDYVFLYGPLDAAHHGLPMARDRTWVILLKREHYDGSFRWPSRLPAVLVEPLLDGVPLPLAQLEGKRPEQPSYAKNFDTVLGKLRREGGNDRLLEPLFIPLGDRQA